MHHPPSCGWCSPATAAEYTPCNTFIAVEILVVPRVYALPLCSSRCTACTAGSWQLIWCSLWCMYVCVCGVVCSCFCCVACALPMASLAPRLMLGTRVMFPARNKGRAVRPFCVIGVGKQYCSLCERLCDTIGATFRVLQMPLTSCLLLHSAALLRHASAILEKAASGPPCYLHGHGPKDAKEAPHH